MLSSVSAGSGVTAAALYGQTAGAGQAAKQSAAAAPQDTVQISAKALAAAGGDADHDGDSH